MSFYRNLFVSLAAAAVISPVFADETATQTQQAGANAKPGISQQQPAQASDQQASGKATLASNASAANPADAAAKINLNKATVKELLTVKGINKSQARAIVAYRKKHGDFKSMDELNQVRSFKNKPLDKTTEERLSIQ